MAKCKIQIIQVKKVKRLSICLDNLFLFYNKQINNDTRIYKSRIPAGRSSQ